VPGGQIFGRGTASEPFQSFPIRAFAACKRLEFLHEEIVDGDPVYVFKDALLWEVAQQSR
jgi:hypothetical protein